MDQHGIEQRSQDLLGLGDPFGAPARRTTSRTEQTISGRFGSARAASSSGSSSKRSCVRPKGNCSVITTSGASARSRPSRPSVRWRWNASSSGAAVEPGEIAQALVGARATAAAGGSARRPAPGPRPARRPRPAARRSRRPPARAPARRRGADGRCPAGAARRRRRGSCSGTLRRSTVTRPSAWAEKKCRQRQSSLCGGRPIMSQPVASASRARIVALCDTATTGSPAAAIDAVQRPMRAMAARGDSPPGGWKSSPLFSAAMKAAPTLCAQLGDGVAFPGAEAHLAQRRIDDDRRRGLQQLGGAARALQRAAESAASHRPATAGASCGHRPRRRR